MTPANLKLNSSRWSLHAAGACSALVLTAAYYFLVYQPLQTGRQQTVTRIEQLTSLLGKSAQIQRERKTLSRELTSLQTEVARNLPKLAQEVDREALLGEVKTLAATSGLAVTAVNWGVSQEIGGLAHVELGLTCSGSFAGIQSFLTEIPHLPWIASIDQMSLHSDDSATTHSLDIRLRIYYRPDKSVPNTQQQVL
jgi:Tfp pilus assembly protein PilO